MHVFSPAKLPDLATSSRDLIIFSRLSQFEGSSKSDLFRQDFAERKFASSGGLTFSNTRCFLTMAGVEVKRSKDHGKLV